MNHRLNRFYIKAQNSPHSLLLVLLISITIVTSGFFTYIYTNNNLADKRSELYASLNELNNITGNIKADQGLEQFRLNYGAILTPLKNVKSKINDFSYKQPNSLETLLRTSESSSLKNVNEATRTFIDSNLLNIDSLVYEYESLQKFIDYDPAQDFAQYGNDEANDLERIKRTKVALNNYIDDDGIRIELKAPLDAAANAIKKLEQYNDVNSYIASIDASQTEIMNILKVSLDELKKEFSNFYNTQLYQ